MTHIEKHHIYNYVRQTDEELAVSAAEQMLLEIHKSLAEMRALAIYAVENQLTDGQRASAQARIDELKKEIDGIAAMFTPSDIVKQ